MASYQSRAARLRKLQRRIEAEAQRAVALPEGVLLHAPWAMWGVGICAVWRRMARALADTGVPVQLSLDPFYGGAHPQALAEVADLAGQRVRPRAFVGGFSTAGDAEQAKKIEAILQRSPDAVITTMIERDRIGPLSVAAANRCRQIWLPCDANIEAFRKSGVEAQRLRKVRVPFFPNDPHLGLVGRARSPGPTHFYHVGTVDRRKDQPKMVLSFLGAFRPGEAVLTIKTTMIGVDVFEGVETDEQVLANGWTTELVGRSVQVVNEMWSEVSMLALHRRGDVYLSLSHAEGWDMPAMDALLSGNQLVYTASGGPEEFASEGDLLVPTTSTPLCAPSFGWEPDARWSDYDRAAASAAMRHAHENPLPKEHRRTWAGYTAADVGALMKQLLESEPARLLRAPSRGTKKDSLAIVSLFRQCPEEVVRYRAQVEALDWPSTPEVVCVEGDSTDWTPDLLDLWEQCDDRHVHVIHHSLGNPLFGSTLNPLRLLTLATVSNVGFDFVADHLDVEYVLFLTSDLLCPPDLPRRLRDVLGSREIAAARPGVVAPMIWWTDPAGDDVFYDTWAFRADAKRRDPRFDNSPRREALLTALGPGPERLESVGSVLFCRAAPIYAGVRYTLDEDVVGFCKNMRGAGYSVWADPTTGIYHPRKVHTEEIRET